MANLADYFLWDAITAGAVWNLEAVESLLPGIGSRELAAAARSLFAAGDLTLVIMAPEAEALPDEAEIRRIIAEAARARVSRPVEKPVGRELLEEAPEPGSIVTVQKHEQTGALTLTLSNGATVILQNTANKNNEIAMYALGRGGYSAFPEAEAVSAITAADLAESSGLGPYNVTELEQLLTGRQISFSFWASALRRGFEGSSTREDIKTFFELLWLGFTQPRVDDEALRVLADQYRTMLVQQNENPERFFFDEINRIVAGNNRWMRPLVLEDIDKINREEALRFIRRAANPADYTFVFTGNVDLDFIGPYLETYLASIPGADTPWNSYTDPGIARPEKSEHQIYKGREEKSLVFLAWYKPEPYSLEQDAAATVLSEYLDVVLLEKIRESLGEVYTLSTGADLAIVPPPGELSLINYFGCSPGRALELSDMVIHEVEEIAQGRIDRELFTKTVESLQSNWEESMQSNRYIAQSYASFHVLLGLSPESVLSLPARYGAVRPQDIQNLCRDLLPRGPARIILYPEAGAGN
jgi:zinc protease